MQVRNADLQAAKIPLTASCRFNIPLHTNDCINTRTNLGGQPMQLLATEMGAVPRKICVSNPRLNRSNIYLDKFVHKLKLPVKLDNTRFFK
jgi:hypothetical protein